MREWLAMGLKLQSIWQWLDFTDFSQVKRFSISTIYLARRDKASNNWRSPNVCLESDTRPIALTICLL
jgi:hypothetical protein